jgi:hypothetical protein
MIMTLPNNQLEQARPAVHTIMSPQSAAAQLVGCANRSRGRMSATPAPRNGLSLTPAWMQEGGK